MQRGLIQFLLDYTDNGYLELNLPYIVREEWYLVVVNYQNSKTTYTKI